MIETGLSARALDQFVLDRLAVERAIPPPLAKADKLVREAKGRVDAYAKEALKKTTEKSIADRRGMYDSQIDAILEPALSDHYLGTFMADEMPLVVQEYKNAGRPDRFGFVMNTDNSTGPGKHWTSVYVDGNSVEYYNSLGDAAPKALRQGVAELVDEMNPDTLLKWKVNRVVDQTTSWNCGWHALRFLLQRFSGTPFREASRYNNVSAAERAVIGLKKRFGYV